MAEPYQDSYTISFRCLADMMTYHAEQTKRSQWERKEVITLFVEPLDEGSPLYGDTSTFAPSVSQEAIADTAKNLGLAVRMDGVHYPVRETAFKSLLEYEKRSGKRGIMRSAVGEQSRDIEHLHTANKTCDKHVNNNRSQRRQCNMNERFEMRRAINRGGLKQRRAYAHNSRDKKNHRNAVPHPKLNKSDNYLCVENFETERLGESRNQHILRFACETEPNKEIVHRPDWMPEQRAEQQRDTRGGDDVRHVKHYFEEADKFQFHKRVCKPRRKREREQNLWNEVDYPNENRVFQSGSEKRGINYFFEIVEGA